MDRRVISTLLVNDLRLLLRSGRTLFMSVVLPLLLFPAILFLSSLAEQRQERRRETTVYRYALIGEEAAAARSFVDETERRLASSAAGERDFFFAEQQVEEAAAALEAEELHFYIEAVRDAADGPQTEAAERAAADRAPAPTLRLYLRRDRDDSESGGARMQRELRETRRLAWEDRLREAGFPIPLAELFALDEQDLATAEEASGLLLGRILTLFLVLLLVSGGSVVAMDSLAGEKERGTLETLLTTAASRAELVVAKSLSIVVVGVVITLINIANLMVWIGLELIPVPDGFAVPVDLPLALFLLLLSLPVIALISSLLLVVSAYAKTYKEAQLVLFPLTVGCVAPTLVAILPGLELRSAIALVPLSGVTLAVKEALTGSFDWPFILLAWASTAAAALYVGRLSARTLSNERLITASDFDVADFLGGPALFPRRVLRWFAVLWALFLVVQLNFGPPRTDVRVILVVNMGLFLVASLLMIARYRLPQREALSLRLPAWQAWVAVLLGVPAGIVLSMGVGELSGLFFPVPQSWLEAFEQALLPAGTPFWQLLLLLAILPGICEEIAFRGVLLYGLRRRLRPLRLVLAVGLVFGLFHVDLFRILPTAFLGVLFAAVTLLSGSIFPAMLWHAAHNGLSLLAGRSLEGTEEPNRWLYPPALLLLALALWILWRSRRPLPELEKADPGAAPASPPEGTGSP